MAGGMDGFSHACGSLLVNVNWNDVNRNWNVNDWNPDNDVNAGRRVFSGNSQRSPTLYKAGVFDSMPFFHPPIMRPSSCISSEMAANFLISSARVSHAIRSMNFNTSVFFSAAIIVGSFSALLW